MAQGRTTSTDARRRGAETARYRIVARGRVQGVGFRPTFHRALTRAGFAGTIRNTPEGVVLEVEGPRTALDDFVARFRDTAPERARVDELDVERIAPTGQSGVRIVASDSEGRSLLPIPPDLATCSRCDAELNDAADRRLGYPFNTCTACGPRFSIALQVPFDRETNTMRQFPPCECCSAEYADSADRRFHAQTISCPECGPTLSFLTCHGRELPHPIGTTAERLAEGGILAVKGVGGFHLACDATREDVVSELRRRKRRPAKPLAVMVPDLESCKRICVLTERERDLLTGPEAPIVLLERREGGQVADAVAPGLRQLGVMLAYTPLHKMLFDDPRTPRVLVMTSCNRRDEPIAISHEHILADLADIVDGVLTNNRSISNRCDDSVVCALNDEVLPVRRSRGYVPEPITLEYGGPSVLATGGMLKNTFALTTGRRVFVSQHIGDVSDADNAEHFARTVERFGELLRIEPEVVVCDMHPDYPTTAFAEKLARERGLPLLKLQQHHAHLVSCMAEHGIEEEVIGVSLDGSGYGEDGAIWGGEFMFAGRTRYTRRYHLNYVPLPGGEQAVLHPIRMAASHLAHALGGDAALARLERLAPGENWESILAVAGRSEFSPPTSSAGRLFDAVAALLGVRSHISYEGQAACELEALATPGCAGAYPFGYDGSEITTGALFEAVCADMDAGVPTGMVAARFHNTVAEIIVTTCRRMREERTVRCVALSGGVMQNRTLLRVAVPQLRADGFRVILQNTVPANDAGLCLGQAAYALATMRNQDGG